MHEELVTTVLAFNQPFETGSATVPLDLMNFLGDWLVNPIKGIDRNYVPTIKGEG